MELMEHFEKDIIFWDIWKNILHLDTFGKDICWASQPTLSHTRNIGQDVLGKAVCSGIVSFKIVTLATK
jgi:hypothetical protein